MQAWLMAELLPATRSAVHCKARSPDKRLQQTARWSLSQLGMGCWRVLRPVLPATGHRRCLGTEGDLGAAISTGIDKQAGVRAEECSATAGGKWFGCMCRRRWKCYICVCNGGPAALESQHVP